MKSGTVEKWIQCCILVYPLLLPAGLYVTWLIAALSLGKWPRQSVDDPDSINMAVTCARFFVLFVLVMAGLPIYAVLSVFTLGWGIIRFILKRPRGIRLAVFAFLSMVLLVVAIRFIYWDPLSVFNWFLD